MWLAFQIWESPLIPQMLVFRMSSHRFRGMQHLLLLNRPSACIFFPAYLKADFLLFLWTRILGDSDKGLHICLWSFSLQAEMILTIAHLWDLWVWWRSRFSESINRWRGVLEREAEIWAESARLILSGKASAAEDQQPVCVRCLPLQCHPIRRKVRVWNAEASFSDFPLTSSTECTFCVWTENFITFFILLISLSFFNSLHKAENTGKEMQPEGPSV